MRCLLLMMFLCGLSFGCAGRNVLTRDMRNEVWVLTERAYISGLPDNPKVASFIPESRLGPSHRAALKSPTRTAGDSHIYATLEEGTELKLMSARWESGTLITGFRIEAKVVSGPHAGWDAGGFFMFKTVPAKAESSGTFRWRGDLYEIVSPNAIHKGG